MCNSFERRRSLVCTHQNVLLTLPCWFFFNFSFCTFFFSKEKSYHKSILARVLCFKLHPWANVFEESQGLTSLSAYPLQFHAY